MYAYMQYSHERYALHDTANTTITTITRHGHYDQANISRARAPRCPYLSEYDSRARVHGQVVKLGDLGFAVEGAGKALQTFCGSPVPHTTSSVTPHLHHRLPIISLPSLGRRNAAVCG